MRDSKVVNFSKNNSDGHGLKLFSALFYLLLAFLLTFAMTAPLDALWLLILLGLLYNFLLRRRLNKAAFKSGPTMLIMGLVLVIMLLAFRFHLLVLVLMSGLYWLLVGQACREAPYFVRYHIMTALILNGFILLAVALLWSLHGLVLAGLKLAHLTVVSSWMQTVGPVVSLVVWLGLWGLAFWLAASALLGRTPYIPFVTKHAQSWV